MTEVDLMRLIMLELSKAGARVFRNNVAQAWVGTLSLRYQNPNGSIRVELENARPLHAGLCTGSSDLIGFSKQGHFIAIEVKTKTGRVTSEQQNFINAVRASGGIAGVCRSVEEALRLLNET